jgi:hypothetical protein
VLLIRYAILLVVAGSVLLAQPVALAPEAIVEHFCAAAKLQEGALDGASMDVDIEASLPKLKKQGKLHALRKISMLGRITYDKLKFEGDGSVKDNVIARYLKAETQAQDNSDTPSITVTPDNYKFKFKGPGELDGHSVYLIQVTPRKKRVGLFQGTVWVDAESYLRVQESGTFVKNPSVFVKRVAFVRKYEIRGGISVPRHIQSVVDTRLVGKAELNIEFSNFSRDAESTAPANAEGH